MAVEKITDRKVRLLIQGRIKAAELAQFNENKLVVVPRWLVRPDGATWTAVLNDLSSGGRIHGVFISRVRRKTKRYSGGRDHWWTYALDFFEGYDIGNAENNSDTRLNNLLDAVDAQLELAPTLTVDNDTDFVESMTMQEHEGLQVDNIDLIENKVHWGQAYLTVRLSETI